MSQDIDHCVSAWEEYFEEDFEALPRNIRADIEEDCIDFVIKRIGDEVDDSPAGIEYAYVDVDEQIEPRVIELYESYVKVVTSQDSLVYELSRDWDIEGLLQQFRPLEFATVYIEDEAKACANLI